MTRVIVISKQTAYSKYIVDQADAQAEYLIAQGDPSVARWQDAHDAHERTMETVLSVLHRLGVEVWNVRGAHLAFDSTGADLVVTVGGDGTLLAASHHVEDVPMLGFNSAPKYSVGFFCSANTEGAQVELEKALEGRASELHIARMQVTVNQAIRARRVLNEALFCHSNPAATSRYILSYGSEMEHQVSSGMWISTAAGSTGAIRSAGGDVQALTEKQLQVMVREPYSLRAHDLKLRHFFIGEKEELKVHNKMPTAQLYLDGPFRRFDLKLGDVIGFTIGEQPLRILGLAERSGRFH